MPTAQGLRTRGVVALFAAAMLAAGGCVELFPGLGEAAEAYGKTMGNLTALSVTHRCRTGDWPSSFADFDEEDFKLSEVPKDDSELALWDRVWLMRPEGDTLLLMSRDGSLNPMRLEERDGDFVWTNEPKSATEQQIGARGGTALP